MDDLAQNSPWRHVPRRPEPALPYASPIVFHATPAPGRRRRGSHALRYRFGSPRGSLAGRALAAG